MLFDTHTHIEAEAFEPDREEVIARAVAAGVSRMLTVGSGAGFKSAQAAVALAEKYSCIWAAVGVHPHDAREPLDLQRLRSLAVHPRVVAIGETGLDFYRDWSPRDLQETWFRSQIELALELNKPLIIHSRDAGRQCLDILRELGAQRCAGVFHCYSEDENFAAELREINFLVSFPGSVTFKKADEVRRIAGRIPLSQIMIETDAPYITPEPHRGRRNESSFIVETARKMAELKGLTLEELARQTTETALKFFRIDV